MDKGTKQTLGLSNLLLWVINRLSFIYKLHYIYSHLCTDELNEVAKCMTDTNLSYNDRLRVEG